MARDTHSHAAPAPACEWSRYLRSGTAAHAYDKTTIAVSKVVGKERELTRAILALESHYLFDRSFCQVGWGNEKGHVENNVGCPRRNPMVAIPSFPSCVALSESGVPNTRLINSTCRYAWMAPSRFSERHSCISSIRLVRLAITSASERIPGGRLG
jgi:hypothetical protein